MTIVYIYTLSCPMSGEIKYVGKTTNLKLRFNQHVSDKRKMNKVKSWLSNLKSKGLKPVMNVVDECDCDSWRFWESYWICQLKCWGFDLKNMIDGGLGTCEVPIEVRNKISKTLTGRKLSDAVKGKISKKVCQYDLQGNFIAIFPSEISALRHFNSHFGISSAIIRKQSAFNFQWRYYSDHYFDNIGIYTKRKSSPLIASNARKRMVLEVDISGNYVNEFASIKEAEMETKLNNISAVCNGKRRHAGNRIFKLAIDATTLLNKEQTPDAVRRNGI